MAWPKGSDALDDIAFDLISELDVPKAFEIESESYPADEAATLDAFVQRQKQAPELFLGAYIHSDEPKSGSSENRKLIGYICATLSSSSTLTHSSMSTHEPNGTSVCIHSVCAAPAHRRRGIATRLLKEYLSRLQQASDESENKKSPKYSRVLLIAHDDLRALYENAGFEWVGPSAVVHGARPWFEMRKLLDATRPTDSEVEAASQMLSIPPDIMQALQASLASSSRRARPTARLLSSNAQLDEVLTVTDSSAGTTKVNKYDLLCPRLGCGCLILKSGAAQLVDQDIVNQEVLGSHSQVSSSPSSTPASIPCWIVEPNPMVFENIGFSKSVPQSTEGPKMKYLLCADCDHGSLGWTFEGDTRFWVICSRVGYKAQDT
ncbi:acyl-CoA N-acyltransferase [Schizopora paradoxa]|uniref:Acyl-CoA N-acyltransferase n=1 Tax=Schizopora paradoxa TaxID=27342 RepID=A0A0H2S958_9AGAM|nr:acyl-CoA N-acyltransferase [Schizopora paradoxa]